MKEKIYTIPLNDAVNADDECPFCFIERVVEQDLLDFVLGSGSSYMESDVREITDRTGFCRMHFKKMFDYGNTLGNGWILKTHYKKMNQELQEQLPQLNRREHKVGRLLLRLSNHWQPIVRLCNHHIFDAYLKAGCMNTESFEIADSLSFLNKNVKTMVVVDLDKQPMEFVLKNLLPLCHSQVMLVLLGNLHARKTYSSWLRLQESEFSGITYDLYYVGVVFFDHKIYKQHYRVNF